VARIPGVKADGKIESKDQGIRQTALVKISIDTLEFFGKSNR